MKYDSGPPTATLANTTHRLRQLLETRPARGAKDERIRELHRGLCAYVHQHPRASDFILEADRSEMAIWQVEAEIERPLRMLENGSADDARRAAAELTQEVGDVDSYLLASMTLLVLGDLSAARICLDEAITRHGVSGYAAILPNQVGLLRRLEGRIHESIEQYRLVSLSPVAAVRRIGLAAGTFASTEGGVWRDVDRFLERLGDEEDNHQIAIFNRIVHLRRRLLGSNPVGGILRSIASRAAGLRGAPEWASVLGQSQR